MIGIARYEEVEAPVSEEELIEELMKATVPLYRGKEFFIFVVSPVEIANSEMREDVKDWLLSIVKEGVYVIEIDLEGVRK